MKLIPSIIRDAISRLQARNIERHKLTGREIIVRDQLTRSLVLPKSRLTREPVTIAMVGLTGSGKSAVARILASDIGAAVISSDAIRVALRETGLGYDAISEIAEHMAGTCLITNVNVVFDADFVSAEKRALLSASEIIGKTRIIYVRTICDIDTMIGRGMRAEAEPLFAGAHSTWDGPPREQSAVVKLREFWRQTPRHYEWDKQVTGGFWHLRRFGFVDYTVDTTEEGVWKKEVRRIVAKLK